METGSIGPAGPGRHLGAATSFYARMVLDPDGDVVGTICDLMLDLDRGCVAYAVVATDGFLGLAERLFPVPWSALRAKGQHYVLECKRSGLDTELAFDRDHLPLSREDSWHERVHAHYRSRPYWK